MKFLLSLFLLLLSATCFAQIYVAEQNGEIIFSDTPMKDAKKIELSETKKSTDATPAQETTTKEEPAVVAKVNYQQFRIIAPTDKETLQNQPTVTVNLTVEPALQDGDNIQLFLDGKKIGEPTTSTTINVGRVDRGAHELYGLIIDKDNRNVLQSNVITVYIQQAHTGEPRAIPQATPIKVKPTT